MAKKREKTVRKGKKEDIKEEFSKKEQAIDQNKILRNFFIGMIILILLIVLVVYAVKSTKKFEYEGVSFEIVKTGNLVLYNTKIPIAVGGKNAEYNFYLRNDPRKIGKEVPFEGNLSLAQNLVLNSTEDFNCDGYGVIAIANLVSLYKVSGIEVIKDQNATCDSEGRYAFINIQSGNQTRIDKFGPACYNVSISNCEILEGTERLMLESFIEINKLI